MCDLKMFHKSLIDYNIATMTFKQSRVTGDEMYLDGSAYHIQQSFEFALKGYLEFIGVTVPRTHKIEELVAMSHNNGSPCIITEWLEINKRAITTLESESRYGKNFYVSAMEIHDLLIHTKEFLQVNGICNNLMEQITEDVKVNILEKIPLSDRPKDNMEWNVLYIIYSRKNRNVHKPVNVHFSMSDYFTLMGIKDPKAEIERLKIVYDTDDIDVIKSELQKVFSKIREM